LAKVLATFYILPNSLRLKNFACDPQSLVAEKRIVVLVKVYQETRRAKDLADRLHCITAIDKNISAIVVGTERERENGRNPTLTAMRGELADSQSIIIVEATGEQATSRPNQINFALAKIEGDEDNTWILHIDADTDISHSGVYEIIAAVNSGSKIILHSSLFTRNFESLGYLQKGHAILQSRWTLSHELLRIRLFEHFPYVLTHIVGHGSCIQLAKLREYGGWPPRLETEDIELGFYFCVNRETILSLSTLNNSDTPLSLGAGFKQELAWSFGALNYFVYPVHFLRQFGDFSWVRLAIVSLQGILLWLNWMLVSWVVIGALCYFVGWGSLAALMFLSVYFLDYLLLGYFCYAISVPGASVRYLIYIPAIFVLVLRRSLSANIGLLRVGLIGRLRSHKTY
jgi:hypothetical protein